MKLLHLFWTTFTVGAFTFGGGYAIIPILKGELVDKLRWVSAKDFGTAIAVGQLTPGPLSILVAFLGWKIAGLSGAAVATLGLFLPMFLAVLLLCRFYNKLRNNPRVQGIMHLIYPTIGALLLSVSIDFAKELRAGTWENALVGVASFVLMSFTSLSPAWLLGGCIVLGMLWH